jgi:hypothetical protein
MNPIQLVILSKIRALVEMSSAAAHLKHSTSIGNVREELLTSFVRELLPTGISSQSGILADWQGNTSPQLDLVLTIDSSLPVIAMREGVALIPFDSALLAIEIKSTLDSSVLDQLKKQNSSIADAVLSNIVPSGTRFIIPTMIVATEDSKLSADTVSNWMIENPNTVACCVVGKYFVRIEGKSTIQVQNSGNDSFNETMQFIECLYESIKYLRSIRSFDPKWASFLLS